MPDVSIVLEEIGGRLALPFQRRMIRQVIPPGTTGVYLLLNGKDPVYVGRSDTCLRRRLVGHPLLERLTHVAFEACGSPCRAFYLEAFWFHELMGLPTTLNLIHPARPAASDRPCPFCDTAVAPALERALPRPPDPMNN